MNQYIYHLFNYEKNKFDSFSACLKEIEAPFKHKEEFIKEFLERYFEPGFYYIESLMTFLQSKKRLDTFKVEDDSFAFIVTYYNSGMYLKNEGSFIKDISFTYTKQKGNEEDFDAIIVEGRCNYPLFHKKNEIWFNKKTYELKFVNPLIYNIKDYPEFINKIQCETKVALIKEYK